MNSMPYAATCFIGESWPLPFPTNAHFCSHPDLQDIGAQIAFNQVQYALYRWHFFVTDMLELATQAFARETIQCMACSSAWQTDFPVASPVNMVPPSQPLRSAECSRPNGRGLSGATWEDAGAVSFSDHAYRCLYE